MATPIEYALLAGSSYYDTREDINRFPVSEGWNVISRHPQDSATGFEASAYINSLTGEIVISYAGTYDKDIFGDIAADIGLATGFGSAQLLQAAEYYLQVKVANPFATITLTGHSLGGGLAALVGVFFGVPATTFDQAPFANSAQDNSLLSNPLNIFTPDVAANLRSDLAAQRDVNGNRIYSDATLSGLTNFLYLRAANGYIPNSGLVSTIRVNGEFLSSAPLSLYDPLGNPATLLDHGPYADPSLDMHSQALLTAFLQSDQTAATGKALSDVTYDLTDVLGMIFDENLFENEADTDKKNFLDHLVRHEAGVQGAFGADAMVTRFTADLWKLAQPGGLTLHDNNPTNADLNEVSQALIAFAMQKYYEETATSAGYRKELFTDLTTAGTGSNGIRFDLADVSAAFKTAFDNNQKLTLKDAKGFDLYFKYYLGTTNNFTVTDTLNRATFMLGGSDFVLCSKGMLHAANEANYGNIFERKAA